MISRPSPDDLKPLHLTVHFYTNVVGTLTATVSEQLSAHEAPADEGWRDFRLAGVVLDGVGARCADRPGGASLACILDDGLAASSAPSPASGGALEELAPRPRAGVHDIA